MYENGKTITIGQTEYFAVFNVAALEEVTARYGGLEGLSEELKKEPAKAFIEIAWLIELLTAQGAALKKLQNGTDTKTLTANEIKILMAPKELIQQQDLILDIINAGMGDEDEESSEDVEVDEVLEEIKASKNVGGAGG